MIDSDKMIRLGKASEPSLSTREAEHQTLSDRVAAFLAQGGTITQVDNGICTDQHYPIRRTREAQINFIRHRTWSRLNNK